MSFFRKMHVRYVRTNYLVNNFVQTYDQVTLRISVLIKSPKLSNDEPGQFCMDDYLGTAGGLSARLRKA